MTRATNSIDVNVPVRVAYNQWTQFESFPKFMGGVERVRQIDDRRLHWVASVAGKRQEWDAEITEQLPDQKIAWRSLTGDVNAGVVTFNRVDGATTTILLTLEYEPQGVVESAGAGRSRITPSLARSRLVRVLAPSSGREGHFCARESPFFAAFQGSESHREDERVTRSYAEGTGGPRSFLPILPIFAMAG